MLSVYPRPPHHPLRRSGTLYLEAGRIRSGLGVYYGALGQGEETGSAVCQVYGTNNPVLPTEQFHRMEENADLVTIYISLISGAAESQAKPVRTI